MRITRTSLAVVLLLLAFGLSAPAIVGPMLVDTPAHQNVSPETPQRISFAPRAVVEEGVPRFGRDVAPTSSGPVPQLDGVELGRALGTPMVPEGFANSASGGGTGWAVGNGGGNGRRRSSENRIFAGGGSAGSATPGLLGWGLRDARGSAAATTVAGTSGRPAQSSNGGGNGGGSQRGGGAAAADDDRSDADDDVDEPGEATAVAPSTDPPAGTPAAQKALNTVEPKVTGGKGGAAGVLGGRGAGRGGGGNMPAATPEPATLLLVGSGAAMAGFYRLRRRPR